MNDHILPHHRRPVVIADSRLRAGEVSARVPGDDPEALLRQYLRLIRRVRNQQRDRSVALRRADIAVLADHLDWTAGEVLVRLADLMGATQRQRTAMLAILATGASLITIAGPLDAVAASRGADADVPTSAAIPVVVLAEHLASDDRPSAEHTARLVLSNENASRPPAGQPSRGARHAPVLDAQQRRASTPSSARLERPTAPVPDTPTSDTTPPPTTPDTTTSDTTPPPTTPDTPAPRSAAPPTPADAPATDTTVTPGPPDTTAPGEHGSAPSADHTALAHGAVVAVSEPPVPPATDADGNSVAVDEPPIPPPPDVAVGEPPIPPPPDVAVGEPPVPPADSSGTANDD